MVGYSHTTIEYLTRQEVLDKYGYMLTDKQRDIIRGISSDG